MITGIDTNPYDIPLREIDVSDPRLYRDDTIDAYFERLRKEAPVHYCAASDYGAYWSITKYDDIVKINASLLEHHSWLFHAAGPAASIVNRGTEAATGKRSAISCRSTV